MSAVLMRGRLFFFQIDGIERIASTVPITRSHTENHFSYLLLHMTMFGNAFNDAKKPSVLM